MCICPSVRYTMFTWRLVLFICWIHLLWFQKMSMPNLKEGFWKFHRWSRGDQKPKVLKIQNWNSCGMGGRGMDIFWKTQWRIFHQNYELLHLPQLDWIIYQQFYLHHSGYKCLKNSCKCYPLFITGAGSTQPLQSKRLPSCALGQGQRLLCRKLVFCGVWRTGWPYSCVRGRYGHTIIVWSTSNFSLEYQYKIRHTFHENYDNGHPEKIVLMY